MATIATLDISTVRPDGKTRKVQMQTDAAEKFRLVQLPTQDRCKVTVGPLQNSSGALLANRLSYAFGASGTYTNNASGTAIADGAVRGDLQPGEVREFTMPLVASQRPAELVLWSDSTAAYAEITLDSVE